MTGWIKLHRVLLKKAIWKNSSSKHKNILITLMMLANHKAEEWEWQGKKFVAMPGQMITSLDSIAKESGKDISIQNVRSALKKFEKYNFLTDEPTKTGRLITITNWQVYQGGLEEVTKLSTMNQQSTNKALTPNNNDKNNKNDKNKDIAHSHEPLISNEEDYKKNLIETHFEKIWKLYPMKKGKGKITLSKKKELYKLGDEIERCIGRYTDHVEVERRKGFKELRYQDGSRFFTTGYIDFLDDNFQEFKSNENTKKIEKMGEI